MIGGVTGRVNVNSAVCRPEARSIRVSFLSGVLIPESAGRQTERLSLFLLRWPRAVDRFWNMNLVRGLGPIRGVDRHVRYRPRGLCVNALGLLTMQGSGGVRKVIHRMYLG